MLDFLVQGLLVGLEEQSAVRAVACYLKWWQTGTHLLSRKELGL